MADNKESDVSGFSLKLKKSLLGSRVARFGLSFLRVLIMKGSQEDKIILQRQKIEAATLTLVEAYLFGGRDRRRNDAAAKRVAGKISKTIVSALNLSDPDYDVTAPVQEFFEQGRIKNASDFKDALKELTDKSYQLMDQVVEEKIKNAFSKKHILSKKRVRFLKDKIYEAVPVELAKKKGDLPSFEDFAKAQILETSYKKITNLIEDSAWEEAALKSKENEKILMDVYNTSMREVLKSELFESLGDLEKKLVTQAYKTIADSKAQNKQNIK